MSTNGLLVQLVHCWPFFAFPVFFD